jgi:hypothetical protein
MAGLLHTEIVIAVKPNFTFSRYILNSKRVVTVYEELIVGK